ncbi:phage tail tip lysozyme [Eubacterium sp. Marseille-QA0814]|uniref:phage tail tip lysozyme n=1 Tax=Eubacterium sp. Marseille-QA0814 TaxID=3378778 RepID=UPI003D124265
MKNVLKKGIAFTLALTLSVSSANVSLFITKANQQAEEKSNVKSTTVYNNKNEIVSQSFVDYDGRTVKELSNGLYIDYTYDASGRVFTEYTNGTNQNNPSGIDDGKLIVKTYDEKGNQTATITNPEISGNTLKVGKDSIVTTNEYNQNGNLIKSTDGEGNQTKYEYDEQGRTTKVITPSDATNTYSYDELIKDGNDRGVVDTVTDALGRVSKTTNNGSDQITKIEDIASTKSIVKTYEYDSNGRQTKEIYSDGSYIQNTYEDATGELIKSTRIDDSGNVEGYTQYEYTVDDKVKSAIDYKSGKPYRYTYYEYDAYGRNTGVAEINATSTPTTEKIKDSMIKYVYDVDDNIIKIYYPNSSKDKLKGIKFIYNKDKWITEIDGILSGGDDDTTVIRKYDYYSNAKVRTIRDYKNFLNKGTDYIQRDYSYDKIDRVVLMTYFTSDNPNTVKEKYEYKYDKNSNITYKHEISNYEDSRKDEEVFYAYDEEGRLVKSEKNNKLTYKTVRCTYKYDKVGNRTYESEFETYTVATDQSKTTGYYSYNGYNELNQLTSSTVIECADGSNVKSYSKSYNYDNKGNQISVIDSGKKTNTTYKYDVNSQLIDVEIKTNGVITSKQHNEYNGQGQRILKTDTQIEGNKVNYQTINYYYEGSLLLYTTDEKGNKTSQNIIGNDSNAFATIRYDSGTQTEYFYSKDVQGSVVAILNNSGKCEQAYSYTDYGETQKNIDSKFYNEICYTGGIYDENTGLYYLNARYYDSSDGEFLSQDTYRGTETDKDTWNLYAYCSGNPINYVDPSGHKKNRNSGQYYPAGAWDSIREQEAKKYTYYNTNKARKYIYKYLRKKLKTNKKQACAILGNIYVETWHTYSSLILQGSSEPAFWYVKKYDAYDSKGWGILQWTYFTRKEALLKYVKKANNKHRTQSLNVGDLIVQLEYFNKERKSAYKNKWKIFKGKKEIADMVNSFCKDYEQAGVPHLDERINTAKKLLKKYK